MRNFIQFIQYHNAIPVALGVLILGAGGVYAASDPAAVYSATKSTVSVDNTYLVGKDLASYSPKIVIGAVTEDAGNYYVSYTVNTIDVADSVWKDIARNELMQVSKADLGPYRDLGLYVTDKMNNIVDHELQRLVETQTSERKNVSQKVVATQYGGLVGKFLDATTETLPGYTPVVLPPPIVDVPKPTPEYVPSSESNSAAVAGAGSSQSGSGSGGPASPTSSGGPVLQILGNNPTDIPLGSTYSDLGAVIISTPNNFTVHVALNGVEVQQVSLDTSVVGGWEITYTATDQNGYTGVATRTVRVVDPNAAQAPEPSPEVPPVESPEEQPESSPEPAPVQE